MELAIGSILLITLVGLNIWIIMFKKKQVKLFNKDFDRLKSSYKDSINPDKEKLFEHLLSQKYHTREQFNFMVDFYKKHLKENSKSKSFENNLTALGRHLDRGVRFDSKGTMRDIDFTN